MTAELSVDDLLMAHAAGKLATPVALVVSTHLALSPHNRERYRLYEAIGGLLLDEIEPAELRPGAFERILAGVETPVRPAAARQADALLPRPLADYVRDGLERLHWRHYGAASEAELDLEDEDYRARFIRLKAGRGVPRHTHEGSELTVVLDGTFRDQLGSYGRGDLVIADGSVDHRPIAEDGGDCLCFAVTDAPLRLTGPIGRFLNPFIRI